VATPNSENSLPNQTVLIIICTVVVCIYSTLSETKTSIRTFRAFIWRLIKRRDENGKKPIHKLLKDNDYTALPDYPSSNKQVMSEYRQQRDFPTDWSAGVPIPEKPVHGRR